MSILCYHSVEPDWRSQLNVTPDVFDAQVRWLVEHTEVLPLHDAVHLLGRDGRLPAGTAVLTFDDGFEALYRYALPVLSKYGVPATVFLVAETLTTRGRAVDWVDTAPPWPLRTLSRDQVLDMRAAGVRFESHSYSHHDLTTLGAERCEADLRMSRDVLESLLAEPVTYLAYPRGRHDGTVRAVAQAAGYSHGFALPEQPEARTTFSVPRVGVYPWNGRRAMWLKTRRPYLRVRQSRAFPVLRRVGGRH